MSSKQVNHNNYVTLKSNVQTTKDIQIVNDVYLWHHQMNFVNLLLISAGKLIKEIVIDADTIEIKTVVKNVESLLWILKYSTLTQTEQIADIVAFDNPNQKNRFKIVIILRSLIYQGTINISCTLNEINSSFPSVAYLYRGAEWLEREVWDMYGIAFEGNKDLRRLLTDYGFQGHPLRKDFPLTGITDVSYDDMDNQLVTDFSEVSQEFRRHRSPHNAI